MRKQPRNGTGLAFPLAVRPPHRLPLWRVPVNGNPPSGYIDDRKRRPDPMIREVWVSAHNPAEAIAKVRSKKRYKDSPVGIPLRGLDERTIPYCGGEE